MCIFRNLCILGDQGKFQHRLALPIIKYKCAVLLMRQMHHLFIYASKFILSRTTIVKPQLCKYSQMSDLSDAPVMWTTSGKPLMTSWPRIFSKNLIALWKNEKSNMTIWALICIYLSISGAPVVRVVGRKSRCKLDCCTTIIWLTVENFNQSH